MKLSYTRSGTPDAPAIVFLHGMGMGQWMWHDQLQHFVDYDCYNVDLPGHGGSSAVAWESFDQAASLVAQLIKQEIPNKPVNVVGMSLGATIGLHLVVCLPERINRAVLTGAIGDNPPRLLVLLQSTLLAAILPTKWGKQLFARMLQLPADVMPYYEQSINSLSIPAYSKMSRQIANYSLPKGLSGVKVPCLFATGENDIAFNKRSVEVLARQVPQSVGVYAPQVHHGWNGEDPALFNAMTRAWIEGQPLPQKLLKTV